MFFKNEMQNNHFFFNLHSTSLDTYRISIAMKVENGIIAKIETSVIRCDTRDYNVCSCRDFRTNVIVLSVTSYYNMTCCFGFVNKRV
jgi:hypothetical protein